MVRLRVYLVLAFACAIGLSAASCGGGGGGGTINPPSSPTPPPTIPPSPFVCPTGGCTSFTLSGSSTQTVTRTQPTPVPPPLVVTSTVTDSIAVMPGKTFHGRPATDYKTTETDAAPTQTITTVTDNYIQFPVPPPGNIVNIGYASTDSNGVKLDVQYNGANGIIGQVPCCTGWSNSAQSIYSETDPDGTTITENVASDGSFTLTKTEPAGTTTETQNSNATGTATVPVVGFFGRGVGTGTTITIPAQSGGTINYTLTAAGASPPTPAPIILTINAWYAPSQTLATDTTTAGGVTAIPAGCVAPPFGPSGVQLTQAETRYDVVFGIKDTETTDTWVTAVGPVCQRISDTVNIFYDFSGQTGGLLISGTTPIQTNVISELIGMQAAARADDRRHPLDARSLNAAYNLQVVTAHQRIDRWRLSIRNRQLVELRNFLKRGNQK
ncbi:MAG: hypothetical protein M3Z41_04095 [Candidatus Eremiobacteraeota bacterium]|nr:hypothetical protein [Candidatus Eremiobacteraeota bacterium]